MNSTTNIKRRQMRSTDPRYRMVNGVPVYTNTAGARHQATSNRLKWSVENNPLNWGWEFVRWHADYQPMYSQVGLQLTRVGDCWHVARLGETEGKLYGGSARLVTGYLWALGLPVGRDTWPVPVVKLTETATERLQAEWEAACPPDDYGLEPRR